MPESSLPVEHLFTLSAETGPRTTIADGPNGTRVIVGITGGTFKGARLSGQVEPGGGDWLTLRADGTARLDVRVVLRTDDGAVIYMSYNGIAAPREGGTQLRSAPQFETSDERYTWLNAVQAVGKGVPTPGGVTYEVYALS